VTWPARQSPLSVLRTMVTKLVMDFDFSDFRFLGKGTNVCFVILLVFFFRFSCFSYFSWFPEFSAAVQRWASCGAWTLPYLRNRRVILHTDRAKSYLLKVEGVLHDSVRHSRKQVKVRGKKVWVKPYFVKLRTHKTQDGKTVKFKGGTQVIDRVWQHIKQTTKHTRSCDGQRLNNRARYAEWVYWNSGGDLWLAAGRMLAANRLYRQ
jgi:hypothetical protein